MQRKSLLLFVLSLAFVFFLGDFQNADAQRRGRRGGGYGGYNNGWYGNGYGNGWYGPGYGSGLYGPGYFGGRGYGAGYGRGGYWGNDGYWYYDNSIPYTDDSSYSYYPPDADQDQRAYVTVRVPDGNAQIWIQNKLTRQTGMVRSFQTRPLEPGNYTYKIRAKWMQNGRDMEQTRTVQLQPGQSVTVDFNQRAAPDGGQRQPDGTDQPDGIRRQPD